MYEKYEMKVVTYTNNEYVVASLTDKDEPGSSLWSTRRSDS